MESKYRAHEVTRQDRPDGSILLTTPLELGEVAERTTDWLDHWAKATPDAVFLAERSGPGWRELTFAAAREEARALAAGLLGLGLGPERPLLVLSGNSVNHGLLALATQYVGIPLVPLAEQYALIPDARGQIDHVAALVRPGAVYAEDGEVLAQVRGREGLAGLPAIAARNVGAEQTALETLAREGGDIAAAHGAVTAETVAKILMTSGSTSAPKGVRTTHRMMCTNQAQIARALPFLTDRPPRIVDWLPWNHVFGGNHNFNMMLANGGALYIDGGKPAPHLVGQTLENLRLTTGTLAFNVPVGFALLRDEMARDAELRRAYFADLDMLFYAGASLPQDVWADLEAMACEVRGEMPLFTSSWGLTETAPAALLQHEPTDRSGIVGVPLPGLEVKLVPDEDGRTEVRVRGPSIFDGYVNDPERTAAAFDDEGFFRTGDAMAFVDETRPELGLRFDGRIGEDFKLLSGTWVRAANLRLDVLAALGPLAADVILTGDDRAEVGALILPGPALRGAEDGRGDGGALIVPSAAERIAGALATLSGGSASRIARALILSEPPAIAEGEVTAKGNLNFARIKTRRAGLVARLYDDGDPATIVVPRV